MASTATTTRKTTATKRSTAAKKAAQTRASRQAATARKRSTAARKAAETRRELAKTPVDRVTEYAEKAVLVPVGAALIARDNVVSTVQELRTSYSTPEKAQRELRQRRTRAQRLLKRNRTQVERGLKQRRKDLDLVSARVENAVQDSLTTATQLSTDLQKRITSV